ncbi:D-alanyl-D-alanine carboxypeptidase family protein [Paenibacillus sp. DMB20]|uniref:D-alanyl-D-alanine carboxypeptidase family protein n=1 Tax=Paenibacillus sp. DMB20 TaxID=1642570 RepID=UPI00062826AB|nr:D-alanyl-D-alanine carboxypeptidase family protein [Paenibacillus sp. DMB20]KKO54378.1 peptidase M15 [Paenibacillus sp. DMB20]
MKKRWLWFVIVILIMIPVGLVFSANTERIGIKPNVEAKAVVLMDLNTGRILFSRNGDTPLPPASMSKLMTELIILDEIRSGAHTWDEKVTVSRYASGVGGEGLSLNEGDILTVGELFQSMAVYSANDAAVALAEHFAGSEAKFVKIMNRKAEDLGLSTRTNFMNATGMEMGSRSSSEPRDPAKETRMTAHDTAKLAAHLIHQHPEILNTSSKTQMKLTGRELYLSNTNWMLPSLAGPYSYEGTDGLKTGYTEKAGYCFTGTAEKGGSRLIAVVLGTKSKEARFEETRKLFDYGFSKTLTLKERLNDWFQVMGPRAALFH